VKGEKPADEKAADWPASRKTWQPKRPRKRPTPRRRRSRSRRSRNSNSRSPRAKNLDAPEAPQRKADGRRSPDKAAKAATKIRRRPKRQKDMQEAAHKLGRPRQAVERPGVGSRPRSAVGRKAGRGRRRGEAQAEKNPNAPARRRDPTEGEADRRRGQASPRPAMRRRPRSSGRRTPCKRRRTPSRRTRPRPTGGGRRPARFGRQVGRPRQCRRQGERVGQGTT